MKKIQLLGALLLFSTLILAGTILAVEKPFSGPYMLMGETQELLAGEKITVEDFISPICSNCYLYWKNHKIPYGDDVVETRHYLFHKSHGRLPVILLLVARDESAELEEKMLAALFNARYVNKVNTEDDEVLDAVAASMGIEKQWKKKKDSDEMKKRLEAIEKFNEDRMIERTPKIVIQKVAVISTGSCGCPAEKLPDAVNEVLTALRAYRSEHRQ